MARKPRDSGAVMAGRAPANVEADTDEQAVARLFDYFCTPPWAARAAAELIREICPRALVVREPAAGGGHMAEPLRGYFGVLASDVYDHGPGYEHRDWLDEKTWAHEPDCDLIVTNPLTCLAVFSERVPMTLGKWDPKSFTATSYSVFAWLKGRAPMPPRWFPPGTRARLWYPDDACDYGWSAPLPLFPEE